MRKLIVLAVVLALAAVVPVARAEEGSELEISGNVTTVTGWQQANKTGSGRDVVAVGGILSDGLGGIGAQGDKDFGFFVDQVEVDLAKSFGENIRIRGDLDFTPAGPGRPAADVAVEQAYTTANIPAGNGIELLVGRFNSGIGSEPVDRNELKTISFGMPHRVLLPHNLTGARIGYDFSEATRAEVYVVNDLGDRGNNATSQLPSGGFNISYAWGEEGNQSSMKLSGAIGPENGQAAGNKHFSFIGDLAGNFAVNDAFSVGLEGLYRQDNGVANVAGPDNAQFLAGQLGGTYAFSDVWDGTLRYTFVWDMDGGDGDASGVAGTNEYIGTPGLGGSGTNHELTLATGYTITDGARFALEGRVDMPKASVGSGGMGFIYGVAGMFAYSF